MKLKPAIELHTPKKPGSRKHRVEDTRTLLTVSEHDDLEEAEKAAQGRPYSRVTSTPNTDGPELRDLIRRRRVTTNPDVD